MGLQVESVRMSRSDCARSRCGDVLFAAVAKRGDSDRIDANNVERRPYRIAIDGIADEPLAEDRIWQRRKLAAPSMRRTTSFRSRSGKR
jgi:hypothetical protein